MRPVWLICPVVFALAGVGCAGLPRDPGGPGRAAPAGTDAGGEEPRAPKTLLTWAVGREAPERGDEKDEIVTDRPDFTEASSTVGRGRVQVEGGYTFTSKAAGAGYVWDHTYPEL